MGPSENQQAETHWTLEGSIQTSLGCFSLNLDPQLSGAAAHVCIPCWNTALDPGTPWPIRCSDSWSKLSTFIWQFASTIDSFWCHKAYHPAMLKKLTIKNNQIIIWLGQPVCNSSTQDTSKVHQGNKLSCLRFVLCSKIKLLEHRRITICHGHDCD